MKMNKTVVPREVLIKDADAILHAREDVIKDRLSSLFSKMSIADCRICKRIWPDIISLEEAPKNRVYLQSLPEILGLSMSEISQLVERLQNSGIVLWERGESGTYIQMTGKGFSLYHTQQDILLSYMERVIAKLGQERLTEILASLEELEDALNSEVPKTEE